MSLSSHLFPSPETEKPRKTETNVGGGKQRRAKEKGRLCEKKGISLDNAAFNFNAGNYGPEETMVLCWWDWYGVWNGYLRVKGFVVMLDIESCHLDSPCRDGQK